MIYTTHCWESGEHHGHPGHTCILHNGHDDEHEWTLNTVVGERFRSVDRCPSCFYAYTGWWCDACDTWPCTCLER